MFPFFPDVHGAPFNGDGKAMSYLTDWTVDMSQQRRGVRRHDKLDRHGRPSSRASTTASRATLNRYGWFLEMDMRRPVDSRAAAPAAC